MLPLSPGLGLERLERLRLVLSRPRAIGRDHFALHGLPQPRAELVDVLLRGVPRAVPPHERAEPPERHLSRIRQVARVRLAVDLLPVLKREQAVPRDYVVGFPFAPASVTALIKSPMCSKSSSSFRSLSRFSMASAFSLPTAIVSQSIIARMPCSGSVLAFLAARPSVSASAPLGGFT